MANEAKAHKEHSVPVTTYLAVAGALFVLTAATVGISFVDLGPFNLVVAMGIAAFKASLVALIFMHLYYDDKLYLTIFIMALLMLALFIIITLFDTLRRGDIYEEVRQPIRQEAVIYDSTRTAGSGMHGDTTQQEQSTRSDTADAQH